MIDGGAGDPIDDLNNAIKREKYFKSAAGRRFLKQKRIVSEALNLGSLPE